MADKPFKKPAPTSSGGNESWNFLITSLVILALLYGLYQYIISASSAGSGAIGKVGYYFSVLPDYLIPFFAKFMVLGIFVGIAFAILSVIWGMKYFEELKKTKEVLKIHISEEEEAEEFGEFHFKWEEVVKYANSQNENDWVRAIISADVILGDILDRMNLPGDTIGDKLKAVEKGDFQTLDDAWEAHKIRNAIAHSGLDFQINQREVTRVIGLYETVFQEFKII